MKQIFICLLMTFALHSVNAQQYPAHQLYMLNPYQINPGFTGYLTDISVFAGALSPLSTSSNSLRNYYMAVNKSFENNYLGVGGKLLYDQRDFFESFYMDASVSYRAVIANKQVLSVGSDIGLVNRTYNIGNLSSYVDMDDPTLSSDYYYQTSFKLGFGLAYYSSSIEAGVAVPYLIEGSEDFSGYFNAYFAYKLYFNHDQWVAQPNVFWQNMPDGTMSMTGNLMLKRRGMFWIQMGGDTAQAIHLSTGWMAGVYELVYAHQLLTDDALPYSNRAEVLLKIHFGKSKRIFSHIASPRNKK